MLLATLLWGTSALAQESTASPTVARDVAPVTLDGSTIFFVSGSESFPSEQRAQNVQGRLIDVAGRSSSMTLDVSVSPVQLGHAVIVDGEEIVVATVVDAEREGLGDTELMAEVWRDLILTAVRNYRGARSSEARQQGLVTGAIWTVSFVTFTALLIFVSRRLSSKGERIVRRYLRQVEEATQEIVRARAITEVVTVTVQGIFVAVWFVALYYYVTVVLFSFAETRAFATVLLTYVTDPVSSAWRAIVDFLPSAVVLILIFLVTRYLIRIARVTFENIEAGTVRIEGFQQHWVWPSYNIVRGLLIISAIILAFPYIPGSDSAAFQGMSILLGVMVSIGSNSVVSNVLAGLFVIYRRSTNVGDRIKIGDHIGEVVAIKLTETHLKSFKNELISIPNGQLLNSEVINYSQHIDGRGLLVHTNVGIGYDEPHHKVEELLVEAAKMTKGIKKSPPPFVMRKELGDFAVIYEINGFSTRGDQIPRTLSDLRGNILDVFHRAGVQIMSPHYEGDPEIPKIPEVPEPAADAAE
ncbi:MAG: mechanosensitive ion channel domain-containing protein [Pseudomonadota bacterium]